MKNKLRIAVAYVGIKINMYKKSDAPLKTLIFIHCLGLRFM